jgi:hypothetical protein
MNLVGDLAFDSVVPYAYESGKEFGMTCNACGKPAGSPGFQLTI